jgi:lectin-like protein
MLGASSFRRIARAVSDVSKLVICSRALLALSASLVACLPERALSSYVGGTPPGPVLDGTTGSNFPDAAPAPAPVPAPEPDAGIPAANAGAVQDAALPSALLCSEECACERRGEQDFMFCGTAVGFDVALERCAGAGGTLVSIEDEQQNTWLSERMQALQADDFWLSGTDTDAEGVWRWIDGRVFFGGADAGAAFAPWDDGQPNDLNGEDCMRSTGGVWRDLDCADEIAFVCQG